jgi:DNA-binding response OmpR family regulator
MNPKVMLIEDDHTMMMLLTTLMRFEGFETAGLKNDESLETIMDDIRQEMPDVILLDVHLGRINGLDLLSAVRKDEKTRRIGVVMSSGMDVSKRCLELGADAFILKPFMPEDLLQQIRQVVATTE